MLSLINFYPTGLLKLVGIYPLIAPSIDWLANQHKHSRYATLDTVNQEFVLFAPVE